MPEIIENSMLPSALILQIAPNCLHIFIKSKLFQASTILPSRMRVIAIPVNSTGSLVAANPKLWPRCLPRTLQRLATRSPSCNHIFDDHLDVGKRFAELRVKGQKSARPFHWGINIVRQAVRNSIFAKQFRNRIRPALVPDFFEPAAHQGRLSSFQIVMLLDMRNLQ